MRRAGVAIFAATLSGSLSCVIITGSTAGYGPVEAGAPACDLDASIRSPAAADASLGDASATLGGCVACVDRLCAGQVTACQDDCACREAAVGFFACVGGGRAAAECASATLEGGTNLNFLALGSCFEGSGCATSACGASP